MKKVLVFVVMAIVLVASSAIAAKVKHHHYTITDLGTLPGGSSSYGYGINNLGEVTGTTIAADGTYHAFLWSKKTKMQDLGLGTGTAINDIGQVTGGYVDAFFWCTWTGRLDLGFISADSGYPFPIDTGSIGYDINNFGQITGWSSVSKNYWGQAFLWTEMEGIQDIAVNTSFGVAQDGSWGSGMNDSGQIVIAMFDMANIYQSYLWSEKTGTQPIPYLNENYCGVRGYSINNVGQITGWASPDCEGEHVISYHTFLWSERTGIEDLGTLPGDTFSGGISINDLGQIVGCSSNIECTASYPPADGLIGGELDNSHAFLYSNGKMVDLNTLIHRRSGWVLYEATGINNKGQITGWGIIKGQIRAFLLTPKH